MAPATIHLGHPGVSRHPSVGQRRKSNGVGNNSSSYPSKYQKTAHTEPAFDSRPDSLRSLNNTLAISPDHLSQLNARFSRLPPERLIEWALLTFPGKLFQTTSFGPTGSVIIHLQSEVLRKLNAEASTDSAEPAFSPVPLIFIDTLHHFPETTKLAHDVSAQYGVPLLVFKPDECETREDFAARHGEKLWERDGDSYDYLVKSEPSRRAYAQTGAAAVITGRRRTQKGEREVLRMIEIEESSGLVKLNPLAHWTFEQVWSYIRANQLPYNPLHDQGYKSIGDYHSTEPTKPGEGERDGRWRGQQKTECGLHKDYFAMRKKFLAAKREKERLEKERQDEESAKRAA